MVSPGHRPTDLQNVVGPLNVVGLACTDNSGTRSVVLSDCYIVREQVDQNFRATSLGPGREAQSAHPFKQACTRCEATQAPWISCTGKQADEASSSGVLCNTMVPGSGILHASELERGTKSRLRTRMDCVCTPSWSQNTPNL